MKRLAEVCEKIAATSKKLEKVRIVAEYFTDPASTTEDAACASVFLSGRPFPIWEETTLQVGGSILWRIVAELSGNGGDLDATYRRHGDLGAVAGEVLPTPAKSPNLSVSQVQEFFRKIASARGPAAKGAMVRELLLHSTPLEAKYIIKIMTGDLRIGLKESLVEEAIAKAYGTPVASVQRANMLLGDIGQTLRLAAVCALDTAKMRLFHPLGFMLASPAESAEEALSYFQNATVEDKYDGIRAQAHCSGGEVRIYSRTRDEITESFPELTAPLGAFSQDVILDGEILAWSGAPGDGADAPSDAGRALPFSALQQRLGRKKVSEALMQRVPVAYLAFDVLYAGGELLIHLPLRERASVLDQLFSNRKPAGPHLGGLRDGLGFAGEPTAPRGAVVRASISGAASPEDLDRLFDEAQGRGNEGLMIKDPESSYTPGRRGKSWLKMKRHLATLDVVVTGVEYGHGRRIKVLSDYTFAVRDGERLVNIGKAYSGLTDVEISKMTKWFLAHTVLDQGLKLVVEPKIVIEVAFNNMMRSERHESGYALRFPRIVRLRPDKLPEEADTIERVREIYAQQAGNTHSPAI
ncbi:MAG: ATP-dependent DNA ligase [Acidobacteriales bacterium]|nr:ATP-dependent DNA ligase [Terriglobales bacterium]